MSLDENKALVRRYFGEFGSQSRLDLADELFGPDYLRDRPLPAAIPPGPERAKWIWSTWRAAFPDWRIEIVEMMGEGDRPLIPPGNELSMAKLADVALMTIIRAGRDRTEAEFRALLAGSGFRLDRAVPLSPRAALLEATPVAGF